MKVRPIIFSDVMVRALLDGSKTQTRRLATSPLAKCEPGDLLYVREGCATWIEEPQTVSHPVVYTDDPDWSAIKKESTRRPPEWKVRPSIHMPRWASRLTLSISDVRRQRLHDLSEEDAGAEGVDAVSMADISRQATMSRRSDFAQLWDKLHGAGSWDQNPEIVALTFRVHCINVDKLLKERAP